MNLSIRQYIIQEGYIIKNWKESDKSSMSDHRIVKFYIEGNSEIEKLVRNPRRTNWNTQDT